MILVGTRPLEICSSLKLPTELLPVIKVGSEKKGGFERCVRKSLLECYSREHIAMHIAERGARSVLNGSSVMHCAPGQSSPSAASSESNNQHQLPPASKAFPQRLGQQEVQLGMSTEERITPPAK